MSRHECTSIDALEELSFDYVISMGCGDACLRVSAGQREEWNMPDPNEPPEEALYKVRDRIEQKVRQLITRIRKNN